MVYLEALIFGELLHYVDYKYLLVVVNEVNITRVKPPLYIDNHDRGFRTSQIPFNSGQVQKYKFQQLDYAGETNHLI